MTKKKALALVVSAFVMFLLMPSCEEAEYQGYNEILEVIAHDAKVDEISHCGSIIPINDGFVYSKNVNVSETGECTMEYFSYSLSNNKNKSLGIINNWIYEASYDSIYNNGHVYMLIVTDENAETIDGKTTYLYDIDISNSSMTNFLLGSEISPYCSMAIMNEEIFLSCPDTTGCLIYRYDILSKRMSIEKEYVFDMDKNSGEVVRHISTDGDNIYLLRLKMNGELNVNVYLDVCDDKLNLIDSINITEYISEFVIETEDPSLEIRQLVSNLEINSSYVYYENFSITRAMFSLYPQINEKSDNIKGLIKSSPNIWKALTFGKPGNMFVFYELLTDDIYLYDVETQKLLKCHFNVNESDYGISKVMQWGGEIAIFLSPISEKTKEDNYSKVFFTNISNLYEGVVMK